MTGRGDTATFLGRATARSSRAGFGRHGAFRLRDGGVAIVGAIATLHRREGTHQRESGGNRFVLGVISRPGGACGQEILGNSVRRPSGAGSIARAIG